MIKRVGIGFILMGLMVLTAVPVVLAKPERAVSLIYFEATEASDGVHLHWETGTEVDTVAYYIRRADNGDFVDLTELYDENGILYPGGIIDSEGGPTFGYEYLAVDRTAVTNTTYTYQLMEVESNNSASLLETVIITTGATATPTSITINTGNPTATSGQTNATNTAVATMTATRASSAATVATNTPVVGTNQTAVASPTNQIGSNSDSVAAADNSIASTSNLQNPANSTNAQLESFAAQTEPTPSEAYPGGVPTVVPTAFDESYPVQPTLSESTPTPYPADFSPTQAPTPTIIGVIGDSSAEIADNKADVGSANGQTLSSNARSLSVLWGGFILAGIIFAAAIIGSIMVFVRKRD